MQPVVAGLQLLVLVGLPGRTHDLPKLFSTPGAHSTVGRMLRAFRCLISRPTATPGPCPEALHAVQSADATHYPDPGLPMVLREGLGAFHGVTPARIVLAASAASSSTASPRWPHSRAPQVAVPQYSYGDYAQAAQVRGLEQPRSGGAAAGR